MSQHSATQTPPDAVGTPCPSKGELQGLIHGDLSPDQLLVVAGSGDVVLTDLDRAAVAPAELDHASLVAVDLLDRAPALTPLLEGYAATTGARPRVPGPWVAAAVLARVAEPWRHQVAGWPGEVVRRALDIRGDTFALRVEEDDRAKF